MNSLRLEGQKTVAIEIVQQLDWEVPDVDHHPGRQPRQRQRARRGLRHDGGARPDRRSGRASSSRRRSAPTRCISPTRTTGSSTPVQAQPTLATRDPDRQPRVGAKGDAYAAEGRRHRGAGQRGRTGRCGGARRLAPGCSTVRTRAWRWRCWKSWSRVATSAARDRVIVISTANGLKFTEFKQRYHEGALPLTPHYRNVPVAVPNDYDAVRRAVDRLAH